MPATPIECRNLVAGHWISPETEWLDVESPYTAQTVGRVALSTAREVDAVVAGAKAAAGDWARTPIKERTALLFRYRELVLRHLDDLANRAALESGKTVAEGRAGVLKGVEVLEYALSLQNDLGGAQEVSRGVTCEVRREPLRVVPGITPFNFPAMEPMWL